MFILVAPLLLLVFSIDAFKVEDHHESLGIRNVENPKVLKTHQILKSIGKRYFPNILKDRKDVPGFEDYTPDLEYRNPSWSNLPLDNEFRTWDLTKDDVVNERRKSATWMMVQYLILSTDSRDFISFPEAMSYLRTVIDPDFFAEICEDGKQLNPYQYLKFVEHSSTHYTINATNIKYELLESNRRSIHAKAKFLTRDNSDLKVLIEYEFKMKLTFTSQYNFSLIYLKQGGSCVNDGQANMDLGEGVKDIVAEELEGLKTAPTMKLFFELFTPTRFKELKEDPNFLPIYLLAVLRSSVVQISVCHEGVLDNVMYTIPEFVIWYEKFNMMWHQKSMSDSNYIVQILELTSESISARLSMRLQMGLEPEEPEEDWNFKFTGKKMDGVWILDTVTILCTASIKYKEQSLKNVRDLIAGTFIQELGNLNDTQYSYTPELIKMFTKTGSHVEVTECRKGEVTSIKQADLFNKDKTNFHGIKFTKYSTLKQEVPSPAPDTHIFRFDTVGVVADSSSQEEKEYQWAFDVKWDQKDQFYYIWRMGIGCAEPYTIAKLFEPISFIRKPRPFTLPRVDLRYGK